MKEAKPLPPSRLHPVSNPEPPEAAAAMSLALQFTMDGELPLPLEEDIGKHRPSMDLPREKSKKAEEESSQTSVAAMKSETSGETRDAVDESDSVGRAAVSRSASLIKKVAPSYPEVARLEEQEGKVVLLVQVDIFGTASDIRVSDSSGHPLLDEAAQDAVARWTFHPALENGRPVFSWVKIPVAFRLSNAGS